MTSAWPCAFKFNSKIIAFGKVNSLHTCMHMQCGVQKSLCTVTIRKCIILKLFILVLIILKLSFGTSNYSGNNLLRPNPRGSPPMKHCMQNISRRCLMIIFFFSCGHNCESCMKPSLVPRLHPAFNVAWEKQESQGDKVIPYMLLIARGHWHWPAHIRTPNVLFY